MSGDFDFEPRPTPARPLERRIAPLKPRSVQTESVDAIEASPDQPQERTIEALNARSVQTKNVGVDATLVIDDDPADGSQRTVSELEGEVKSLRSRCALLRAERTAIAGRKYALEVVLESLKEKLGAVADLAAALDAPGELGEALRNLREMVGEARRIAEGKNVLETELEEERAERLRVVHQLETKVSELTEQSVGDRAERDALRERAGRLERERLELLQRIAELEKDRGDAQDTRRAAAAQESQSTKRLKEMETAVVEAAETAQGLLRRAELAEADVEKLGKSVSELEQQLERARDEAEAHRMNLAELERKVEETETRALAAEEEIATLRDQNTALSKDGGQKGELEAKLEKKEALVAELRGALTEIKPVFDELDRENKRLGRLLGEARERGRVNIEELIAREQLLKKLERLTKVQ